MVSVSKKKGWSHAYYPARYCVQPAHEQRPSPCQPARASPKTDRGRASAHPHAAPRTRRSRSGSHPAHFHDVTVTTLPRAPRLRPGSRLTSWSSRCAGSSPHSATIMIVSACALRRRGRTLRLTAPAPVEDEGAPLPAVPGTSCALSGGRVVLGRRCPCLVVAKAFGILVL